MTLGAGPNPAAVRSVKGRERAGRGADAPRTTARRTRLGPARRRIPVTFTSIYRTARRPPDVRVICFRRTRYPVCIAGVDYTRGGQRFIVFENTKILLYFDVLHVYYFPNPIDSNINRCLCVEVRTSITST